LVVNHSDARPCAANFPSVAVPNITIW